MCDNLLQKLALLPLNFSAQTNARKVQETIEGKLIKLRKNLLGAPAGKKMVPTSQSIIRVSCTDCSPRALYHACR